MSSDDSPDESDAPSDDVADVDDSHFMSGPVADNGFDEQTIPESADASTDDAPTEAPSDQPTDTDGQTHDRQPRTDGLESPRSPPIDEPLSDSLTYADSPRFDTDSLPSHMRSAVLPGQFDLPYVYARTDKEISKWERPKNVRVNVFPEVGKQLAETEEYLTEEVFPETDVKTCDVYMAALVAGMLNVDDIETLFENWGYDRL